MDGLFDLGNLDFTGQTAGGYNNLVEQDPGFSYGNPPSDAYLQSILDPTMQPSYLTPQNPINPYTGQPFDIAGPQAFAGGGSGSGGLSLGKILGGLGGLATALGPALGAAGQLAMNALSQRPFYRNQIPFINAPPGHTAEGATRPLSLGGQVVTNDPLANYVKLIQGMR